ncbi:hypothetical protein FBU59_004967 [Linderina macrospora]|uniref:Uncharacterized protein n=1 Tax=Linderina macrospora TaxID=4868 RepID=A0ACC1J415_9FUNG|nr:hypothetical protein FBU59_004967 [Linderina macrospora]
MSGFSKKPSLEQQREMEDADLVHAMARQYVIDAEAAGSATPGSRRSRMTLGATFSQENHTMPEPLVSPAPPQHRSMQHQSMADSEIGGQLSSHMAYSAEKNSSLSELADPVDRRIMDEEEFEDDANEARHFVPTRMRYPPPKYEIRTDTRIPLGAMFFVAGFLVMPFWWIGVVLPRKQDEEVARTWRKYNSLMTLLSLPLLGLFLALGGWHATH